MPDQFPEMNDVVLGDEELNALFRDYRACAVISDILIKTGPRASSPAERPTLDQAEERLRSGTVRGIQVRYQFAGNSWCDTLMPLAAGVRLIRIRQTVD